MVMDWPSDSKITTKSRRLSNGQIITEYFMPVEEKGPYLLQTTGGQKYMSYEWASWVFHWYLSESTVYVEHGAIEDIKLPQFRSFTLNVPWNPSEFAEACKKWAQGIEEGCRLPE